MVHVCTLGWTDVYLCCGEFQGEVVYMLYIFSMVYFEPFWSCRFSMEVCSPVYCGSLVCVVLGAGCIYFIEHGFENGFR